MLTAGPPVTPAEQEIFVQTHRLTSAGVPAGYVTAALAAIRKAFVVYRTDSGWNELKADVAALSAKPWYPKTPLAIASRDDAWWKWYASFMDYDPRPALAKMTVPIFVALGENDALFDREAMSREWANVAALPSHDVAVHVYPGAGHALRAGSGTEQPAAYWTDLAAWLTEKRLR